MRKTILCLLSLSALTVAALAVSAAIAPVAQNDAGEGDLLSPYFYDSSSAQSTSAAAAKSSTRISEPLDIDIHGYVNSYDGIVLSSAGMYSLPTTENEGYELLSSTVSANYGGVEVDGYYYAIAYSSIFGSSNTVYKYDTSTWERISYTNVSGCSLSATDLTYDVSTGNVYGCFVNDDNTGYVFGKLDLDTYKRTALFELDDWYQGVAADALGTIYVIDRSGNLLTLDKTTGATTLIGSTGLNPNYVSSATIDKSTGRMFYCYNPLSSEFALYEIDTATAEATLLTPLFGHAQVTALEAGSNYGDKAPAAASDLSASCVYGTLAGSVSFTAPSTYYDGETAEGELAYTVLSDDGTVIGTGTTTYGAETVAEVTYLKDGEQDITIIMSNATGYGPRATTSVWAGTDTPEAPVPTAVIGGEDNVQISWSAVGTSVNGLTIPADSMTYTVVRLPEQVTVAQSIADTAFVDSIAPYTYTSLYYSVTAEACGLTATATTNDLIAYNEAPYTADFYNNYDLGIVTADSTWTIIDVQGSGKTWANSGRYLISTSSSGIIDAWAIFAIRLEGGKYYEITLDLYNRYNCNNGATTNIYALGFDMYYGKAATVNGMTECLIDSLRPTTSKSTTDVAVSLVPETTGIYYVGLHVTSYGLSSINYFRIQCLNVSAGADASLPVGVSDISIVPDTAKEHKAQITFVAPVVNLSGDTLTSLSKIEVARGEDLVKTFESPAPGDTLSFEDSTPSAGMFTYTFTPYNTSGAGTAVSDSAFVGVYIPAAVPSFTAVETETDGEVTFAWTAPTTDANGEALDADDVSYDIYDTSGDEAVAVATGITGTSYTYTAVSSETTEPQFMNWTIYAVTEGGTGAGTVSGSVSVGTPFAMPYRESFAGAAYQTNVETEIISGTTSSAKFTLYNDQSAFASVDDDNGMGSFYVKSGGTMAISTGKIAVKGDAPVVSFWTYTNSTSNKNTIYVYVRETGSTEWTLLESYALANYTKKAWVNFRPSLADYTGKSVQVRLQMGYTGTPYYTYVDYLYVGDTYTSNLAGLHVNLPSSIEFDEPFTVEAVVENNGTEDISAYTVDLYRNGTKISSVDGTDLATLSFATVSFTDSVNLSYTANVDYYAVVSAESDTNADDNTTATATLTLTLPDYPTVTTLTAEQTTEGVSLAWDKPDLTDFWYLPETTDDFESYDSWATTAGDWLFVDADSLSINYPTVENIPGIDYQSQQSFFVFDATYGNFANYEGYQAHSGNKYLMSIAPTSGACDDWAISPKLTGEAQTVSFYLSMSQEDDGDGGTVYTETYYVYYSTTGTDIDDFVQLSKKTWIMDTGSYWSGNVSFDLPEGALYFAIRRATTKGNGFLFMIDDVTYTAANAAQTYWQVEGYNIWRNHEKLNSEPVSDTAYTDTAYDGGEAEYTVTVVYDCGESAAGNIVTIDGSSQTKSGSLTGISSVTDQTSDGASIAALNRKIVISGALGMPLTIATADGKTIYSALGEQSNTIGVQPGIYIVRVGAKVVKVIVK